MAVKGLILFKGRYLGPVPGIDGGGIINLNNICICDLYSLRKRGKYMGIISLPWFAASAVGPPITSFCGLISEKLSWRWCFYINRKFTKIPRFKRSKSTLFKSS